MWDERVALNQMLPLMRRGPAQDWGCLAVAGINDFKGFTPDIVVQIPYGRSYGALERLEKAYSDYLGRVI